MSTDSQLVWAEFLRVLYLLLRLPIGKGLVLHEDNVPTPENFLVDWVPHSVAEPVVAIAEEYAWPGLWI